MLHEKPCLWCRQPFISDTREEIRGNSKFCSKPCFHKHYSYARLSRPKPNNVVCSMCSTPFRATQSRVNRSLERHGRVVLFCSHQCHSTGQRLSSSIREVQPIHYGTGSDYRTIAFAAYPKQCMRCGYNKNSAAIIVHHKDRKRSNNDLSNLEVLCCNCHAIEHWGEVDPAGVEPAPTGCKPVIIPLEHGPK